MPAVSLYSPPPPPAAAEKTAMGSPGPAHARGELRTISAGFPATRVVGCGETHSRVLASCAASSPDTACRETVARQPTREPLASSTVMGESDPRCQGPTTATACAVGVTLRDPGRMLIPMVCLAATPGLPVASATVALATAGAGDVGAGVVVVVAEGILHRRQRRRATEGDDLGVGRGGCGGVGRDASDEKRAQDDCRAGAQSPAAAMRAPTWCGGLVRGHTTLSPRSSPVLTGRRQCFA